MKYFTKYLPVEGEINEGDKFLDHTDNLIKDAHIPEIYNNPHVPYFDGYKKVKLFLCSRDVQKTDKEIYVHKPDGSEVTKVELIDIISDKENTVVMFKWGEQTPGTLIQNTFKKIGEISPGAKWVKEGNEFDEDEVFATLIGTMNNEGKFVYLLKQEDIDFHYIQVKYRSGRIIIHVDN